MFRKLDYCTRTSIILSNEDYTNAGLSRAAMKKEIERISGVSFCKDFCINNNIEVIPASWAEGHIKEIVRDIQDVLEEMVREKQNE